jgi:hypothetical protein
MNKLILAGASAALLLSACAIHHPHARKFDPHNPAVTVVEGKSIVVDQEPVYFPLRAGEVTITWYLPKDSPYSFPDDGIVVAGGGDEFKCNPEAGGKKFACKFKNSKLGRYKYTIRVIGGPEPLRPLDPFIANG